MKPDIAKWEAIIRFGGCFFVPKRAERRLAVLVLKVKNRLEAAGRKVESQIPRMAGGAYRCEEGAIPKFV